MRRKDREVNDIDMFFNIIKNCHIVHLGMVDKGKPYVVALNFGFEREVDDLILYFHSALEGRKIHILKKNPDVFFQMDCINEFIAGSTDKPCSFSWRYDSVTGSGQVEFLDDNEDKKHALNIMIQQAGKTSEVFQFPTASLAKTCVLRLRCSDFTGKHKA